MPRLFRQRTTSYRLNGKTRTPDGQRVVKGTPGAEPVILVSKKWYGEWVGSDGKTHRKPLSESKERARRMLAKLSGDAQLASAGIVDPFAEHRRRPLLEHLDDYARWLASRGASKGHITRTTSSCRRVLEACGFTTIDTLNASQITVYLAELREAGSYELAPDQELFTTREVAGLLGISLDAVRCTLHHYQFHFPAARGKPRIPRDVVIWLAERRFRGTSAATTNKHIAGIRAFVSWMVRDGRLLADPLAHLEPINEDVDRRHERRALTDPEFARLIDAVVGGESFRGLTGTNRLALYLFASHTGFRATELAMLVPSRFRLEESPPVVVVRAADSKHKREDVQPLRSDVAAMMKAYLEGRPAHQRIWPGNWYRRGAKMVRFDLAAAGIPWEDDEGRIYDFHCLRSQFLTGLARAGVPLQMAKILGRHANVATTLRHYTHLSLHDAAGALDRLPELPGPKTTKQERA